MRSLLFLEEIHIQTLQCKGAILGNPDVMVNHEVGQFFTVHQDNLPLNLLYVLNRRLRERGSGDEDALVCSKCFQSSTKNTGIIGVFSFESFGKRTSEIHSLKVDLTKLAVKDTSLAKAQFIDSEIFIDSETD